MKNILAKITTASGMALISLLFMGVKCDRPESIGPSYVIAPEGFAVTSFSAAADPINFALPVGVGTKLGFNATFTHNVSWTLKLRGLSSSAVKEISGTSSQITPSDLQYLWDGSHDGLYFFKNTEKVVATLTFLGTNLEIKDTVTISGTKRFKDILIHDFEGSASFAYNDAAGGDNPSGFGFLLEGGNLYPFDGSRKLVKGIQGNRSYYWYSQDAGNYFGGGGAFALLPAQKSQLPYSADSLYLNLYIYGQGDPNSKLNFGAREDDDGDGVHEPASEDEFQVQISMDHTGWKLFSYKYSSLTPSTSAGNGGSGNKKQEPRRVTHVSFGLISSPPNNYVEAIIDFPILTLGAPFDPAK